MFTNIRLIDTGIPVDFRTDRPFLQLIPIHRAEYDDEKLNNFTVQTGFDGLTAEDWRAFERTIVQPGMNPIGRRQGAYAAAARDAATGLKHRVGRGRAPLDRLQLAKVATCRTRSRKVAE